MEVVFQAIAQAGAMSFISVFLVRLGAPNLLVGLYTSLPALVTLLTVLPTGSFIQRQRNLISVANSGRLVSRTIVGAFALLPLLPTAIASYLLVGARGLMAIPLTANTIAVTSVWGEATTPARRPRMLGTRMAISGLTAAAIGLLAGGWLDMAPYPLNYQVLFVSAFLAGVGSVFAFSRLRLPDTSGRRTMVRQKVGLRELLPLINSTPSFRNYALAMLIFRLIFCLPFALYSIFRVRTLGASDAWIGVLVTVRQLVSVVAYFALGRLASRPRFRRWLWTACLGAAFYPLTTALAQTPQMLLVPVVIDGIFQSGMNIFFTDTLLQVSSESERPMFVAADAFLQNAALFISPMVGTMLADLTSIRWALIIAAVLRLVAGLVFWFLRVGREQPEDAPPF